MAKYYNVNWFGDDVKKKVMTANEKAITLGQANCLVLVNGES